MEEEEEEEYHEKLTEYDKENDINSIPSLVIATETGNAIDENQENEDPLIPPGMFEETGKAFDEEKIDKGHLMSPEILERTEQGYKGKCDEFDHKYDDDLDLEKPPEMFDETDKDHEEEYCKQSPSKAEENDKDEDNDMENRITPVVE